MVEVFANSGDPDQMPASDLGLHCLPNTLLGLPRLQWVHNYCYLIDRHVITPNKRNIQIYIFLISL